MFYIKINFVLFTFCKIEKLLKLRMCEQVKPVVEN